MIYDVALPFVRVEGDLAPGEAVECTHGSASMRRADAMSRNDVNAGAVAFSRPEASISASLGMRSC